MRTIFNKGGACLKVAFVAGLSDKKLIQKLDPLTRLNAIQSIHLYRRRPIKNLNKIDWQRLPKWAARHKMAGDLLRFLCLMARGWQYDVLIGCNQTYHGVYANICGTLWKKPVIQVVVSGIDHVCSRPLLKQTLLSAQAVAVRGPISRIQLKRHGYRGHIEILHNPLDVIKASELEHPGPCPYDILAVGDYAMAKSYPWMMAVIGRVKKSIPSLRVAIAGKGPFEQKLSSFLNRHGLKESISFLGWQDEKKLAALYQKSRVLLLTSQTEGLPMVVIEAMGHKKPVYVTDVGDLAWLVRGGQDGFVVPYGETEKMALLLINGLGDPESLNNMGHSAYDRILSLSHEFGPARISRSWETLLNEAQMG
jgi:glycosyltransferase involved in cell wall biosynthesis